MVLLLVVLLAQLQPMINRKLFISAEHVKDAEKDCAIPIGYGVTSTRPSMVYKYIEILKEHCKKFDKVLEIGTGCGWQTALLSQIFKEVYSIEFFEDLARRARLNCLEYKNIYIQQGDGMEGLQAKAPFDAVVVCCCVPKVPTTLIDQLDPDGIVIIPVGNNHSQDLIITNKNNCVTYHSPCGFSAVIA